MLQSCGSGGGVFFTITFLLAFCVVSAQEKKTVKKDTTKVYHFEPRFYKVEPCFCPILPKMDSLKVKKDNLPAVTLLQRKVPIVYTIPTKKRYKGFFNKNKVAL